VRPNHHRLARQIGRADVRRKEKAERRRKALARRSITIFRIALEVENQSCGAEVSFPVQSKPPSAPEVTICPLRVRCLPAALAKGISSRR
jgi:hypothetical protein